MMKTNILSKFSANQKRAVLFVLAGLLIVVLVAGTQQVLARQMEKPVELVSPMHPVFAFLDASGENVLKSGLPVSTMKTCGECHDTAFIESHSFHADLGLKNYEQTAGAMNASDGVFGKWDPLAYRYLSQTGDERLDMSTAEWLMKFGQRVPGGGPATTSRNGSALLEIAGDAANPESSILDPVTGESSAWDWQASGTMEMNCFLCHVETPNVDARAIEISSGKFGLANTATLVGTGLVEKSADGYVWNKAAFDDTGTLKKEFVFIQEPTNANCAACHGEVHEDTQSPLTITACDPAYPQTATTGQVIASQKISESGVNIQGKSELARSWDIHAERELKCADCHFSINNPIHSLEAAGTSLEHLVYDPRKLTIGEYVKMPDHNFARGQSAQFTISPENKGTMRRCESCHDASKSHADWLPYSQQHIAVLACESCHIPKLYAPAIESYDWTVIHEDGTAVNLCRGVQGGSNTIENLVTGYKPVFMQRTNIDGKTLLAPYNLITSWYWVYDDASGNPRPVREVDLQSAYLDDGKYAPEIIQLFDVNMDGRLDGTELKITTEEQKAVIADRLSALGLKNVHIEGQVQPYSINHNVARGEYAIRDCKTCHSESSRVTESIQLAAYAPAGVTPVFVTDTNVKATGEISRTDSGALVYQPADMKDDIYVFGKNRINWVDWFGSFAFVATLLAVAGHGTGRYLGSRRNKKDDPETQKTYIYESYERFWHWLQTISIVFLLLTGLVIHKPDMFGAFSFPQMVIIHNVLATILVLNALLSLFWHITTGEFKQYIPRPAGFFDDMIVQIKFYLGGIFKGDPHPFEKRKNKKLNPLQQVTYFGLLTVLLPLQMVTGALMWTVQKWPEMTSWFGGLTLLAPFHSLIAWLLATFVVAHVYLTTTGATPLEAMRGMVTGWEELEVHHAHHSDSGTTDKTA